MVWSFSFRENTDVLRWRDWGRIAYLHSLADTYTTTYLSFGTYPNNMPPGTVYSVYFMYESTIQVSKVLLRALHLQPGEAQWMNGPLLTGMLRVPSIVSDIGLAIIIYKLVRKIRSDKESLVAASLFYFNPTVIYNSAFWGQMDSINNIFFLLGVFFLSNNKYIPSIIAYFLSLFVKFSLIFLLPLYILSLYKNGKRVKPILLGLLTAVCIIFILTLPLSFQPHSWWFTYAGKNSLGEMQQITNFAFNFWWMVYKPAIQIVGNTDLFSFSEIRLIGSPHDSQQFMAIPLQIWGIGLFIVTSAPLYWKTIRMKKLSIETLLLLFSLSTLLGFLFLPRMHERYMYPLFPLLAAYIGIQQKNYWIYIGLSLLNLVNVYIVWHPMRLSFLPYELINNQQFQWLISIAIIAISVLWYIQSIRTLYAKKTR